MGIKDVVDGYLSQPKFSLVAVSEEEGDNFNLEFLELYASAVGKVEERLKLDIGIVAASLLDRTFNGEDIGGRSPSGGHRSHVVPYALSQIRQDAMDIYRGLRSDGKPFDEAFEESMEPIGIIMKEITNRKITPYLDVKLQQGINQLPLYPH